jgi:hypothetical protein
MPLHAASNILPMPTNPLATSAPKDVPLAFFLERDDVVVFFLGACREPVDRFRVGEVARVAMLAQYATPPSGAGTHAEGQPPGLK